MRYTINDRTGNRLGVLTIEVSVLQVMQSLQRMDCILGPALPQHTAALDTRLDREASTSGKPKRSKRRSRR